MFGAKPNRSMRRRRDEDAASADVVPIYFTISRNRMIHTQSLFSFFFLSFFVLWMNQWLSIYNACARHRRTPVTAAAINDVRVQCVRGQSAFHRRSRGVSYTYMYSVQALPQFSFDARNEWVCDRVCWCRWDETQQRDIKQVYARLHSWVFVLLVVVPAFQCCFQLNIHSHACERINESAANASKQLVIVNVSRNGNGKNVHGKKKIERNWKQHKNGSANDNETLNNVHRRRRHIMH